MILWILLLNKKDTLVSFYVNMRYNSFGDSMCLLKIFSNNEEEIDDETITVLLDDEEDTK